MSKKTRILITGGAGYTGSVMSRFMLDKGYAVSVVDNLMFHQGSLLDCCPDPDFKVTRGDCRDERLMTDLVEERGRHPLSVVGAPLCDRDPLGAESINQKAVEMLCRISSESQPILIPTTNSGYGVGEKENSAQKKRRSGPSRFTGAPRWRRKKRCWNAGTPSRSRLATVFGVSPRMRLDLLVNNFVFKAVKDRALVIFEGQFKRNYIHIRDVARAFLHGILTSTR